MSVTFTAVAATIAAATFAIGAFCAVEQERQELQDLARVKANRLRKQALDVISRDRRDQAKAEDMR